MDAECIIIENGRTLRAGKQGDAPTLEMPSVIRKVVNPTILLTGLAWSKPLSFDKTNSVRPTEG